MKSHFILTTLERGRYFIIPILQISEKKAREVKKPVKVHTVRFNKYTAWRWVVTIHI